MKKSHFLRALLALFCAVVLLMTGVACQPDGEEGSSQSDNSEPTSEIGSELPSYEDESDSSGETPSQKEEKSEGGEKPSEKPSVGNQTGNSQENNSKPATGGDFVISKDGEAIARIIISRDATDKVRTAAEDLQKHLKKITGTAIKIGYDDKDRSEGNYILVGPTVYTEKLGIKQPKGYPENERVICKRVNNYIVLIGNDEGEFKGTQYAVNMFLEELGCGWYGPSELWQVVPNIPNLSVKSLNIDHTPQFTTRISGVWFNYEKFSERWYMGGVDRHVGHGLEQLVSREAYYSIHPEWFALCDGSRDPYLPQYWQYCYTNKDLAKEIGKKVIEYFDKNPDRMSYSIGANDAWTHGWCECDNCAKLGSDTDEILYFANNVAEVVAKKYPDRKLTILSYHSTYTPPVSGIKAHEMVDVMFCKETSMLYPLDEGVMIHEGYNWVNQVTYTQSWKDNFEEYITKSKLKNKSIWCWYCIAADKAVWADIPWVQGNVATRDQALWKKNGVDFIYYDSGPAANYRENEASFALRWPLWYVAAKGMWDDSLTGEDILKDACNKLYGVAANEMFAYYKALADAAGSCKSPEAVVWVPPAPNVVYTDSHEKKIDAAVAAVKAKLSKVSAVEKERIENQLSYWQLTKAYLI